MNSNIRTEKITSMEDLPLALSVPEVAEVLKIGRSGAYALVRSGKLPSLKIGRKIRVSRVALSEFLSNPT